MQRPAGYAPPAFPLPWPRSAGPFVGSAGGHGGSGRGIGRAGSRAEGGRRRSRCDRARRRPDDCRRGNGGHRQERVARRDRPASGRRGFRGPCRPRQRAGDRLRIRRRSTALRGGGRRRRLRSGSGRLRGPCWDPLRGCGRRRGSRGERLLLGSARALLDDAEPRRRRADAARRRRPAVVRSLLAPLPRVPGAPAGRHVDRAGDRPAHERAGRRSGPDGGDLLRAVQRGHPSAPAVEGGDRGAGPSRSSSGRGTRSSASPASGHRAAIRCCSSRRSTRSRSRVARPPPARRERSPISGRGRCRGPSRPG